MSESIKGDALRGHLETMILSVLEEGHAHGFEVLRRLDAAGSGLLKLKEGSVYPALYRLEKAGLVTAEWGITENNRKARYYSLTSEGERYLERETETWRRYAESVSAILAVRASLA